MIKEGNTNICALIAKAGRAEFEAKYSNITLMCSKKGSGGYIRYSILLLVIYMIMF
jgi:hypothetical protein